MQDPGPNFLNRISADPDPYHFRFPGSEHKIMSLNLEKNHLKHFLQYIVKKLQSTTIPDPIPTRVKHAPCDLTLCLRLENGGRFVGCPVEEHLVLDAILRVVPGHRPAERLRTVAHRLRGLHTINQSINQSINHLQYNSVLKIFLLFS